MTRQGGGGKKGKKTPNSIGKIRGKGGFDMGWLG